MLSENNKYLKVKEKVVLTELLDNAIFKLDNYFKDYPRYVTSGLRSKSAQMRIILEKAKFKSMHCLFDERDYDLKVSDIYIWQSTWSRLLDMGYIINPPNTAKYIGDNLKYKGRVIQVSTHIEPGNAFDIGASKGIEMDTVQGIINYAMTKEQCIKSFKTEDVNNCFHINIKETI